MTGRGDVVPSVKPDLPATEDFWGFAPYAQRHVLHVTHRPPAGDVERQLGQLVASAF